MPKSWQSSYTLLQLNCLSCNLYIIEKLVGAITMKIDPTCYSGCRYLY